MAKERKYVPSYEQSLFTRFANKITDAIGLTKSPEYVDGYDSKRKAEAKFSESELQNLFQNYLKSGTIDNGISKLYYSVTDWNKFAKWINKNSYMFLAPVPLMFMKTKMKEKLNNDTWKQIWVERFDSYFKNKKQDISNDVLYESFFDLDTRRRYLEQQGIDD